jgi:hypothetical protein
MKKICSLHYDVAQSWLEKIVPSPTGYDDYIEGAEFAGIGQTLDDKQLFIYKDENDEYWLVVQ